MRCLVNVQEKCEMRLKLFQHWTTRVQEANEVTQKLNENENCGTQAFCSGASSERPG